MKKTIEINYGTSITLNRGNYENFKPMWHQKLTVELDNQTSEEIEALETAEFTRIKRKIDGFAETEWETQKLKMSGLRVRIKDGKKYPSVNAILHPKKADIDPEYGLRGQEIERLSIEFMKTGIWQEPAVELKKLRYSDIPYKEFFQKHGKRFALKNAQFKIEVFHEKRMYSGEIDMICDLDDRPTICDFKTGQWDWHQLIAYAKCLKNINSLAILDLKKCEIHTLNMTDPATFEGWEDFLIKRGEFKSAYGV